MQGQGWYYRLVKDARRRPVSRVIKFGTTDEDADDKIRQAGYSLSSGQYLDMSSLHGRFDSSNEAERDCIDHLTPVLAVEAGNV